MEPHDLSNDLLVGIEPIDRLHSRLFSRIHAIRLSLSEGETESGLAQAFHGFVLDLEEWFNSEEAFWDDVEYPQAGEHAASHEKLTVEILKIDWDFLNEKAKISDAALANVLRILGAHIWEWDKPFAELYRQHGTP